MSAISLYKYGHLIINPIDTFSLLILFLTWELNTSETRLKILYKYRHKGILFQKNLESLLEFQPRKYRIKKGDLRTSLWYQI